MTLDRIWKPHYWAYVLIFLVGLVNVISYTNLDHKANLKSFGDATIYITMSQHTFAHVASPFALRLLSPLIVHELQKLPGLGLNSSWLLLTFAATNLALIIFFKLLYKQMNLSLFTSATFTIMLACTYNYTLFNYSDMWLVDPLNNLFYVLALYLCLARRLWTFVAVVALGSINKETTLMLAPLYPLLAWVRSRKLPSRETVISAAAVAGTVVFYLVYRLAILAKFGPSHGFLTSGQRNILETIRFSLSLHKNVEQAIFYGVFQFLWFVFGYGLYRLYKSFGWRNEWLVISVYVLATVIFGRLFATDSERVYVMMAPVVHGVSAMIFDGFRTEQERLWVWLLAFAYLALNFQWFSGNTGLLVNLGTIVIFVLALGAARLDFRRLFAKTANPV